MPWIGKGVKSPKAVAIGKGSDPIQDLIRIRDDAIVNGDEFKAIVAEGLIKIWGSEINKEEQDG